MTVPLLRRVTETLDAAGIEHALIGAAALATHGISRSTLDHDLLTTEIWDIEQLRAVAGAQLDADVDARISLLPEDAQATWGRIKRGS